jgi:inner membrane protein
MDPLTHTLAGAAIARARPWRTVPLALPAALLGANAPDLDAVFYLIDPDLALYYRRGHTHGVVAMILLPLALWGLLLAWDRLARRGTPARAGPLLAVSALATWSHPLLDWLNTYGVRFLMPFDGRWFYGDTLFIVDPWLWLILGGGLFLSTRRSGASLWAWSLLAGGASVYLLSRSAASPAVQAAWCLGVAGVALLRLWRKASDTEVMAARRIAGTQLAALVYVGAMLWAGQAARAQVRREMAAHGIPPSAPLLVGPRFGQPTEWQVLVERPQEYRIGHFSWVRSNPLELNEQRIPRTDPTPAVRAARADACVRGLVGWMRFPYYEIESDAAGWTVWILDARYALRRTRGFGGAAVRLNVDLEPNCHGASP